MANKTPYYHGLLDILRIKYAYKREVTLKLDRKVDRRETNW